MQSELKQAVGTFVLGLPELDIKGVFPVVPMHHNPVTIKLEGASTNCLLGKPTSKETYIPL